MSEVIIASFPCVSVCHAIEQPRGEATTSGSMSLELDLEDAPACVLSIEKGFADGEGFMVITSQDPEIIESFSVGGRYRIDVVEVRDDGEETR